MGDKTENKEKEIRVRRNVTPGLAQDWDDAVKETKEEFNVKTDAEATSIILNERRMFRALKKLAESFNVGAEEIDRRLGFDEVIRRGSEPDATEFWKKMKAIVEFMKKQGRL